MVYALLMFFSLLALLVDAIIFITLAVRPSRSNWINCLWANMPHLWIVRAVLVFRVVRMSVTLAVGVKFFTCAYRLVANYA